MTTVNFRLDDKVALVAGGSRGIGRAIALAFAEAGADVVVSSRGRPLEGYPTLEEVAEEIRARGRRGLAVAAHMAKVEDSRNLVEKIKIEFGKIDILVNNAGTNPYSGPLIDAEEWAWEVTMNVNLKGPFLLSQLVARMMREQGGGNIINIASGGGIRPSNLHIYSVSKAGLIMLTQVMAKEWGQYNIRVNAIAPGMVKTRLSEPLWKDDPSAAEAAARNIALGRPGVPEDIAGVALFLASAASRYITGETILVDGGAFVGPSSSSG